MTWPNVFVDLHWRWPLSDDVLVPESQEEVPFGSVVQLRHRYDALEGEHLRILQPLGIDDIANPLEASDLAVDGLHLRLEVGAAKADHDGARIGGWGDWGRVWHYWPAGSVAEWMQSGKDNAMPCTC